ncbi:uncharacterized protein LOC21399709 [Morus notabilis]|uniref:uncharacterized protein LOC21399709 n=1 Tax=Morus notabilis TaxID=981085 RepID=UPI000CED166E|nr:uncharacterized protein LOC21399709 [Morus notabilis]
MAWYQICFLSQLCNVSCQPTICYSPDYTSFKFTEKNEGMKEEKEHNKSNFEDLFVSNLKSKDCALSGSEERTEEKSHFIAKDDSMDYELPELVVFLQESSYHFVKDVCIDKGMHSHGKCLVENCELDHKIISRILESGADSKMIESKVQTMVTLSSISKESRTTDEHGHSKNGSKKKESSNSVKDVSEFDAGDESSTDHPVGEVQKAVSASSLESRKNSCDSDMSMATTSGREEHSHNPDNHQQGSETRNVAPISTENESPSHIHQHFGAESSHFSSGHFSAHIAHHGAASPSFRSVSHLSNSSTTSSMSFAFPILASEWHGSPERMATPEKKELRSKRRGKFARFLCCKF